MRRFSTFDSRRSTFVPGFTLIEMLVVIGIIAVLATIVGVVVSKARGTADKFRLGAQLQTIQVALDAYKTDFQAYPTTLIDDAYRLTSGATTADDIINLAGVRGARELCKALMGPCPQTKAGGIGVSSGSFPSNQDGQDGNDGLGFRVLPRSGVFQFPTPTTIAGKVYGPYLSESQFKMSKTDATGGLIAGADYDDTTVLLDANGKPILYYPLLNAQASVAQTITTPTVDGLYVSGVDPTSAANNTYTSMYRATDNSAFLSIANFRAALGDIDNNGAITGAEVAAVKNKYILWSAGTDGIFGPNPNATGANKFDDVTNFQGE